MQHYIISYGDNTKVITNLCDMLSVRRLVKVMEKKELDKCTSLFNCIEEKVQTENNIGII